MFRRILIFGVILALVPQAIAHADTPEEITPLAVPAQMIEDVRAIPNLRIAIYEAAHNLVDARAVARDASDAALGAHQRSAQATAQVQAFARKAYLNGSPDSIRVATQSVDGTIGALLHDVAVHRYAGTNVALRAVGRIQEAQRIIAGAAIASHEVTLAEQAFTGRQASLIVLTDRLQALARAVGYPDLVTAALSVNADGCITRAGVDANPQNADLAELCARAISQADTYAAAAITWALARLGAPYACKGVGRDHPLFQFDCSSYVSRAYQDGAGIPLWFGPHIPTTETMLAHAGRFTPISQDRLQPGDLALYDSCVVAEDDATEDATDAPAVDDSQVEEEPCTDRHVVMYLGKWRGKEWMAHTGVCGGVANVDHFWGFGDDPGRVFLGAVRVQRP